MPISTEDKLFFEDSNNSNKEITDDNTLEKDYNKRLTETKRFYPFSRWEKLFKDGFDQYSPQNCDTAKLILDSLIIDLLEIGEHASEESKVKLIIGAVEAFNELNDRSNGILIETDEREELCEFFNHLTIAVGLNPEDYGGGEGIASEYRDW